jgi:hypothetical protein
MGGWFPTQIRVQFFGVDHQQHQSVLPGVKGIRHANDLLLRRAVDESLGLQAGRAILAGYLCGKPCVVGGQMQDQGSTS